MERERIEWVVGYIEAHLCEEQDVKTLARLSGYSEFHFIRMFRRHVGLTPADYVRQRRLSEVVRRAGARGHPLSDAAFAFGFNSKENFSRAFKKAHAVCPAAWRAVDCSLRTLAPFSFDTSAPQPAVSVRTFGGFSLIAYPFAAEPPHCWNRYNTEKRSVRLSGGAAAEDFGAMRWDAERGRLAYYIGVRQADAKGDRTGTVRLEIRIGKYAVFETQPAAPQDFVGVIRRTWDWIYGVWLPRSRYRRADGYELESYIESSRTYTERIYVPIERE